MSEQSPRHPDSLDIVELVMAIEEAFPNLTPLQRDQFMRDIEARFERGEFDDEDGSGDDPIAALVRNLGPRNPKGQAGAAVRPEEPPADDPS